MSEPLRREISCRLQTDASRSRALYSEVSSFSLQSLLQTLMTRVVATDEKETGNLDIDFN